jgi:hypothetical protein
MRNNETAAAVRKCVRMFDVSRCVRIWIFSSLPYEQRKRNMKKKNEKLCNHDNKFFSFLSIKAFLLIITYQFRYEK